MKGKAIRVRRLPVFRSDAEERRFWETHDPADYLDQMRPVRVEVARSLRSAAKPRGRKARAER